ncbi:MAG: family 20 glycosylhydrolase [Candidatus Pedobacter colombiensis]|uniref:beta-N-acetylhexosaminidase n=1 Tax=Candidatus Pedobacter colombiensis TaxID=3121371 RepID=A0AAJ5W9D5_9SPHI|nr:family 20 glycosylhydrolase [Pedobacter sp.]WEK18747.1 MAG: family 20 glycosylhydrolase [Pedobacter sp.]
MKNILSLLCFCLLSCAVIGQTSVSPPPISLEIPDPVKPLPQEIAIIPEPVTLVKHEGHFTLPANVTIQCPAIPETHQLLVFLKERLSIPTGSYVSTTSSKSVIANIKLSLNDKTDPILGTEGYQLSVTPKHISIKANKPAGLFYGVQSLLQLFPVAIESKELMEGIEWKAPCVEVTDYPRLGWRGLMFDVARHFFTKDEVKQYIDAMVRYKYNVLHLHLTDDEGWRIEIKGLPKLTEVGAWSVKKVGEFGNFTPPTADEPRNYGGFYTQEDIKELVKYAKERFVNILPEIDVPGHSLAAIASYPELSCTPGAENYKVRSGERIMDWSRGAPPLAMVDNTLCPANEKVYPFLDTIITQIAALFPFEYIHMGGDEAPFNYWEKSDAVKALMLKEGLKDMHQVQGYFEKRIQKMVEAKGKKFIGWDEILNDDLSPSVAVMAWRGIKYGVEAAKKQHEVVMTPTAFAYLDYMQADAITEPRVYASLRLSKAYEFEPVPAEVDPKYIKGGQGNLWTEQVFNIRQAEYMTWPRGMAIAESLWSPPAKKNWLNFFGRVEQHFKRLDMAETKYAPSVYDPIFKVSRSADKQLQIELSTEVPGLDIYYSFDNSFPDRFYPKYTEKLTPPKDATMLKVITYRGKTPIGRMMNMPIEELNKRAGKK